MERADLTTSAFGAWAVVICGYTAFMAAALGLITVNSKPGEAIGCLIILFLPVTIGAWWAAKALKDHTTIKTQGRNLAVQIKGVWYDLGPGDASFYFSYWKVQDSAMYNPAPRHTSFIVRMTAINGRNSYVESGESTFEKRIITDITSTLQGWAKGKFPDQIFHARFAEVDHGDTAYIEAYNGPPAVHLTIGRVPSLKGIVLDGFNVTDMDEAGEFDTIRGILGVEHMESIKHMLALAQNFKDIAAVRDYLVANAATEQEKAFINVAFADREAKMRSEGIK
jgi:hypothetical protein